MRLPILPIVLVVVLSSGASPPPARPPAGCEPIFARDEASGLYIRSTEREDCFDRLMLGELDRLRLDHRVGKVLRGVFAYDPGKKAAWHRARREWSYRWRVHFSEPLAGPPAVATRFRHSRTALPAGPSRVVKCALTRVGFDLIVTWEDQLGLDELEMEWVAYEAEPPVTPVYSCSESREEVR